MRLENINADGQGKYALLLLRKLDDCRAQDAFRTLSPEVAKAIEVLERNGILDWGNRGTESEFMVIRLKDKWAPAALAPYATAAELDGEWEYAKDIRDMATRAGPSNPWCKKPD